MFLSIGASPSQSVLRTVALGCAIITIILGAVILVEQHTGRVELAPLLRTIELGSEAALVLAGMGLALLVAEMDTYAAAAGIAVVFAGLLIVGIQLSGWEFFTYDFFSFLGADEPATRRHMPLSSGLIAFLAGTALIGARFGRRLRKSAIAQMALSLFIIVIGSLSAFALVISQDKGGPIYFAGSFWIPLAAAFGFVFLGAGLSVEIWRRRDIEPMNARQLGRSIVLYSSVAVFMVTLIGSFFAVVPFYHRLREEFNKNVLETAANDALSTDQFFAALKTDLERIDLRLSNDAFARRVVAPDAANPSKSFASGPAEVAAALSRPTASDAYILGIRRMDRSGTALDAIGVAIPPELWPRDKNGAEFSVTGPLEIGGRLTFIVAVPGKQAVGGPALDLVLIDGHIIEEILRNSRAGNPLGDIYFGSVESDRLTFFKYDDVTGRLVPASAPVPHSVQSSFRKTLPRRTRLTLPSDISTQPSLTAFAPIRASDMGFAISIPARDLYAGMNRELLELIAGALFLAAVCASGIFFLIRRLVHNTEVLQAEVQKSLHEKESLLQEIHHRVKNNLQIVMSLLRLQSRSVHDASTLAVFEESQNRIDSISLLHELCYGSTGSVEIEAGKYLERLSRRLINNYEVGGKFLVELAGDDIDLSLDVAVPFALLMNELLTHAIKNHLSHDERNRQVEIVLSRKKGTECAVSLFDSDQNFYNDFAPEASTFSSRLMKNLLKQLHGKLELCEQGTDGSSYKRAVKIMFMNENFKGGTSHGTIAHFDS